MIPSPLDLLDRCHDPLVRDLAWVLLAPDLLDMPWTGRPTRAELGLADDAALAGWLDALEANPDALAHRIGATLRGRMGLYHECLWQFLLETAPGTRLLAHNLRIHRDKVTLGELDLLYRHRGDPTPVHLEVAIKFYLGLPEGPGAPSDQARWIGPGGADSLATKREHLHQHQLRLTETIEAREAIRALMQPDMSGTSRAPALHRRLAIPGVLFYPWHTHLPPPEEATVDHLRGTWLFWRDWRRFRDGLPRGTRGAWLRKPHWFALPRPGDLLPLRELESQLAQHFGQPAPPVQIMLGRRGGGKQRLFLVDDDWPRQIPLPPNRDARPAHPVAPSSGPSSRSSSAD
ncbi:DUF1853 family protein [Halomonas sp. LBP4]|uniref:DUF1853 family protein n=1 Tax=Halomonas sp. LBP4 TaxID=2044917 RepID=UPI000D767C93|nr:DUF1853 family protein [Halomonas sp. LBP4]PXX95280.1 hypothetical protein CR157_18750 [Halomonas sp. LBP4]